MLYSDSPVSKHNKSLYSFTDLARHEETNILLKITRT